MPVFTVALLLSEFNLKFTPSGILLSTSDGMESLSMPVLTVALLLSDRIETCLRLVILLKLTVEFHFLDLSHL